MKSSRIKIFLNEVKGKASIKDLCQVGEKREKAMGIMAFF